MREIKFRAWDKSIKKMTDMMQIQQFEFRGDTTKGMRIHYTSEEAYTVFTDDYILMQFTGLKDKNGKEIYEGDIIKDSSLKVDLLEVIWMKDRCKFFLQCLKVTDGCNLLDSYLKGLEVIGNIYENPELLK